MVRFFCLFPCRRVLFPFLVTRWPLMQPDEVPGSEDIGTLFQPTFRFS